jgi:3,4-dihydroxy 2-butanone 4-phosphate synthase
VGRENEVDMVVAAELICSEHVQAMRRDAGGLVCLALGCEVGERLGLGTLRDIFLLAAHEYPVLKSLDEENAPYGGKSAFSITINHRRTFTGITDRDRALTIAELAKLSKMAISGGEDCQHVFVSEFKAPGHVNLLLESQGSLARRRGHTELSVYLCRLAGLAPAAAICEMLDGRTHNALSLEDARNYAQAHSLPILNGQQLVTNFLEQEAR